MSKEVSLIDYDKETEAISKYEHYSIGFHNTFGDIRSLHVRLTPLFSSIVLMSPVHHTEGINYAESKERLSVPERENRR